MANPYAMNGLAQGLAQGLQAYLQAQQQQKQWQSQQEEQGIVNLMRQQQMQQNQVEATRQREAYDWEQKWRPFKEAQMFESAMPAGPDSYKNMTAGFSNAPAWHEQYQKPLTPQEQANFVAGLAGKVGTEGAGYLASGAGMNVPGFNAPIPGQQQAPSWNTPDEIANAAKIADVAKKQKEARYKLLQDWIKDPSFFQRPKQDKQFLLQERSLLQNELYGKGSPMNVSTGEYIEPSQPPLNPMARMTAYGALQSAVDNGSPDLISLIQNDLWGNGQNPQMQPPMAYAPAPLPQMNIVPGNAALPAIGGMDAPGGGMPPTAPGNPMKITPANYAAQKGTGPYAGMRPSNKAVNAQREAGYKAEDQQFQREKQPLEIQGKELENEAKTQAIKNAKQTYENAKTEAEIKKQQLRKSTDDAKAAKDKASRIYEGIGTSKGNMFNVSGINSNVAGRHANRTITAMIRQGIAREAKENKKSKGYYEAVPGQEAEFKKRIADLNKQYPTSKSSAPTNLKGDDKEVYEAMAAGATDAWLQKQLVKDGWSEGKAKAKVTWLRGVHKRGK
jgi:hypothetical protein